MSNEKNEIRLEDYRQTNYEIPTVDLTFNLSADATVVSSKLQLKPRETTVAHDPLILDGDELNLVSVKIDGVELTIDDYTTDNDKLIVKSPPAQPFELQIITEISPKDNTKLMGLYQSSGTYCTQCEAEGFRRITYFPDRPDLLSVYTTKIVADRQTEPVLLSNGNPIENGIIEGTNRHFVTWHDPHPKPSYLFALVAGDLAHVRDNFTTMSGRKVELGIYVEHGNEDRCGYAMEALKKSMKWDEDVFGCEYDLDLFNIVAVSTFNLGAMENKGLNVFNDKYVLADPDSATDHDYAGIETVIAHEYFHNWTGNRITCRDWFQLCLKEGLTVFRDQEFTSDVRSRPVKRISAVRTLRTHQFPEDASPLAHPVRPRKYSQINNFYTTTVYEKGAEVIRMLKTLLGADGFKRGMDLYFKRHDGHAATIEEFLTCFADATGSSLEQFMLWYEQSGTPVVSMESHWDEASGTIKLEMHQSTPQTPGQPEKKPFKIPVKFGLVGPNGQDLEFEKVSGAEIHGDMFILSEENQTVTFSGLSSQPVPSLFREFSAPVNLIDDLSEDARFLLLNRDSDPFNRWQAVQKLAIDHLVKEVKSCISGNEYKKDKKLVEAFGTLFALPDVDSAYKALILEIPSEITIALDFQNGLDPDAVSHVRHQFRSSIAEAHWDSILAEYNNIDIPTPYSPDADSAGRRELRNTLLNYLSVGDKKDGGTIVSQQFSTSDNMTDRIAAMKLLVHDKHPDAEFALGSYFDRHGNNSLATDKWFNVQALTPGSETLAKVRELTSHKEFTYNNPNRIRALLGAFSTGNLTGFNRADGAGFEFIADIVLKLDAKNPQIAARLLTSFRSWRSLEPVRGELAKKALLRIASHKNLSSDVLDIVNRTLKQK